MALDGAPVSEAIAVPEDPRQRMPRLVLGLEWHRWFGGLTGTVDRKPERRVSVVRTGLAASVGTTALAIGTVPPGLWRITIYARITQAATTSSSLTLTAGWTDGGIACSRSGAAITGNTTATTGGETFVVRVNADSSLTYATTYVSVGATPMQYRLSVVAELLAAEAA